VAQRVVERDPLLWLSRSWTTRARRDGEPEDAYVFVDEATFRARAAQGGFLEWAEFLGSLYGTPVPEPPAGADVLLEIEVQGARQVLDQRPDAVVILLEPPSPAVQQQRLIARGDDPAHVARRLAKAAEELRVGRTLATDVVVNDDLERAVAQVEAIVAGARTDG
jgi:guanylate kinase